jgi:transposase-like protein
MDTNLVKLTAQVSEHKRGKRRVQYPATVWDSISSLRSQHTVAEISQATGINSTTIYRRTLRPAAKAAKAAKTLFREVQLAPPSPPPKSTKLVTVELRRCDGAELRLRIEATSEELGGLFGEFLR